MFPTNKESMKLTDAIKIGKDKAAEAKSNQMVKQVSRPLTKLGVIKIFNHACCRYGYTQPLITKELERMVGGFVRVFAGSGIESNKVYDFTDKYVKEFSRFKNTKIVTGKGKEFTLGNEPHLKDLLFCRDFLWSELQKVEDSKCTQVHQKIQPLSQEEFDEEFNRVMKEL